MSSFWTNLYKFPRFLITVLIGFFLTTFKPIFKLLKNKRSRVLIATVLSIIIAVLYIIIEVITDNI
uniref:Uncharacterized protein ycf33 n=1 Tax=Periphykon beckeri TaxID=2006982 RepID=A0A1Z1M3L5_9FLOR|nr:hypothetical protein [Periphykon beckeri]ARW60480.1 hypothetical protein [Periphykon beckeri]